VVLVAPREWIVAPTDPHTGTEVAGFLARLRPRFRTAVVITGTVLRQEEAASLARLADVVICCETRMTWERGSAAVARGIAGLAVPADRVLWVDRGFGLDRAWSAGLVTVGWGGATDRLGPVRTALAMRHAVYEAAGGVVLDAGDVVVLRRPDRHELRLPKGHIEAGETSQVAARREVAEETGLVDTEIEADLGRRFVEFDTFPSSGPGWHVARGEHYFRMRLFSARQRVRPREARKFTPQRLATAVALGALTQPVEREWLRLALMSLRCDPP